MGVVAGVVIIGFEFVVFAFLGPSFLAPLRSIAGIILGAAAREPSYSLVTAVLVGSALHVVLSALFGVLFGLAVLAFPTLRSSATALVASAVVYGSLLWIKNIPVGNIAWSWFAEGTPVVGYVAHTWFYGLPLGLLLLASIKARRARLVAG